MPAPRDTLQLQCGSGLGCSQGWASSPDGSSGSRQWWKSIPPLFPTGFGKREGVDRSGLVPATSIAIPIEGLSNEIEILARRDSGCERLMSVPGIGPIISSAIVAAIGNGDAFTKGRDFAAWLGLVPKQISTGDRTITSAMNMNCSPSFGTPTS